MVPKVIENVMAIVQFTDGIMFTCKVADISVKKDNTFAVKYKDHRKYAARVLILSANLGLLNQILLNLEGDLPRVRLGTLVYTGERFLGSHMLGLSKNCLKDPNKLFLNELILPNIDITADYHNFNLKGNATDINGNSEFFEAELCQNGDIDFTLEQERQNNKESVGATAIKTDKPERSQSITREANNQTDFDSNDQLKKPSLESVGAEIIKSDEPETNQSTTLEALQRCRRKLDFDSKHQFEKNDLEDPQSTTTSTLLKPAVICIENVKYDLVRIPSHADASNAAEYLSSIGDQLEHDSLVLSSFDNEINVSLIDVAFSNLIPHNHRDDLDSLGSFDVHNPGPVSSTVLESTVSQNTTNNTKDDSNVDDKDKDYELPEESHTTADEASTDLPDQKSEDIATSSFCKPGKLVSAPDDMNMRVANSSTPSHTKKYFCLYCHKMQTKLARHLEIVHSDEEDVKKFINLPKGNRERQDVIAILRKKGNHVFNTDQRFNDGTLLVCRRPNERMQKKAQDFSVCANCKGQYAKSVVRHHWRKCTKRDGKTSRIVMVKGRAVMARINEKASETVVWKVFSYLREDNVVRAIRYDELIILYANKQCEGYSSHQHFYKMIRARLRLLGRFLIAIKKVNAAVTDFASIFRPACYDSCILAVKDVAMFQPETGRFTHPAVASNIGTYLKHVGELLRSKYIKSENEEKQKQVEDYLKLLSEDYGTSINKAVAETQMQNNRRKKIKLPSTDDIRKLQDYLATTSEKYHKILKNGFSHKAWLNLAQVTLVLLQIFNRRRAGEIERLYTEDFESYQGIDAFADKEIFNSLSKEAQRLAKTYVRFMIRGKRGRGVPVLVPFHILRYMKTIQKFRREAKVPDANPYFFGVQSNDPDRHKYLGACDLLRRFSVECGAEVPSSLRGTELRKHIATQCMNLNLSETQVSDLANFMGHHEKIHKDIYRQPIMERDITRISKLLELAQGTTNDRQVDRISDSESDNEFSTDHQPEKSVDLSEKALDYSESGSSLKTSTVSRKRKISSVAKGSKERQYRVSECGPTNRRSWSGAEKCAVSKAFGKYFDGKKLPSLKQIQDVISKTKCLQGRTPPQIKTWIHNERKKMAL